LKGCSSSQVEILPGREKVCAVSTGGRMGGQVWHGLRCGEGTRADASHAMESWGQLGSLTLASVCAAFPEGFPSIFFPWFTPCPYLTYPHPWSVTHPAQLPLARAQLVGGASLCDLLLRRWCIPCQSCRVSDWDGGVALAHLNLC